MARSGFKMKYSPTKGRLGDFFSSLGKQLKAGQKERGIFSEKGKAEKKSWKAGESKFQADVRRRQETNRARRASNKADAEYYGSAEDKAKNSEANRIKPKSKGEYRTFSGKKGDKFKYRYKSVPGEVSSLEDDYSFQYPKDHEKYKGPDHWESAKNYEGGLAMHNLFIEKMNEGDFGESTPIQKKSRGFKMPGYGKRK